MQMCINLWLKIVPNKSTTDYICVMFAKNLQCPAVLVEPPYHYLNETIHSVTNC